MTKLDKIRDELAGHLDKTALLHETMGYASSKAFKDGFDASSTHWKEIGE